MFMMFRMIKWLHKGQGSIFNGGKKATHQRWHSIIDKEKMIFGIFLMYT